jgi:hypothetical protein
LKSQKEKKNPNIFEHISSDVRERERERERKRDAQFDLIRGISECDSCVKLGLLEKGFQVGDSLRCLHWRLAVTLNFFGAK